MDLPNKKRTPGCGAVRAFVVIKRSKLQAFLGAHSAYDRVSRAGEACRRGIAKRHEGSEANADDQSEHHGVFDCGGPIVITQELQETTHGFLHLFQYRRQPCHLQTRLSLRANGNRCRPLAMNVGSELRRRGSNQKLGRKWRIGKSAANKSRKRRRKSPSNCLLTVCGLATLALRVLFLPKLYKRS